jgi:hypothetical protein
VTAPSTLADYDARIEAMRAEALAESALVQVAIEAARLQGRAEQGLTQCDREMARLRPVVAGAA